MTEDGQTALLEHYRLDTPSNTTQPPSHRHGKSWYRVRQIGQGSFGAVYLEQEARDGQTRAVKSVFKTREFNVKAELLALTRLARPAYSEFFGRFLGWYEDDTCVSYVMEYFKLGDLRNFMQSPFPEPDAKDIVRQLLLGLRFMHNDGFTHRDLKPENIFVLQNSPQWQIKIGDFGVTKRVKDRETALRTMVGTRNYTAPEIFELFEDDFEEPQQYTSAVDIWTVGIVSYELLCSVVPFCAIRELKKFCKSKPQLPPTDQLRNHQVSPKGIEFVTSLLKVAPSERPSATAALICSWFIGENVSNVTTLNSPTIGQDEGYDDEDERQGVPVGQDETLGTVEAQQFAEGPEKACVSPDEWPTGFPLSPSSFLTVNELASDIQALPLTSNENLAFGNDSPGSSKLTHPRFSFVYQETGSSDKGYVPWIVAKCVGYLMENIIYLRSILSKPERIYPPLMKAHLTRIFSTLPNVGKDFDWEGYSVEDAFWMLLIYLNPIPGPFFAHQIAQTMSDEAFRTHLGLSTLLTQMPRSDYHILIYIISFFEHVASSPDVRNMDSLNNEILVHYTLVGHELYGPDTLKRREDIIRELMERFNYLLPQVDLRLTSS